MLKFLKVTTRIFFCFWNIVDILWDNLIILCASYFWDAIFFRLYKCTKVAGAIGVSMSVILLLKKEDEQENAIRKHAGGRGRTAKLHQRRTDVYAVVIRNRNTIPGQINEHSIAYLREWILGNQMAVKSIPLFSRHRWVKRRCSDNCRIKLLCNCPWQTENSVSVRQRVNVSSQIKQF